MLKRVPTKYVRDKAKARYVKDTTCRICGTTENLEFHHYYSVHSLVYKWIEDNNVSPDDVVDWRDQFIAEHEKELYEDTVTLCNSHHRKLHDIYGKEPLLSTAPKQMRWVQRQRDKNVPVD